MQVMKKMRFPIVIHHIMRITSIQLILATIFSFSLYARDAGAQSVLEKPISIAANKLEVRKVLLQIRQQTGVKFTYSSDIVDVNKKISCNLESRQLKAFFDELLKPIGIEFKVIDNEQILLYPEEVPAVAAAAASAIRITGTVTSEQGEPLPGVSLQIKDTNLGTVTDGDGKFSLSVPDQNAILVVSYLGYQQQEIKVGDQVTISIKLQLEDSKLNEVVVVGYGTQRRKDITGAVATVSSKAFENRPIVSGLGNTPARTQAELRLAVEKERQLELAFEGHRMYDLIRTNRAEAVMNAVTDGSGNPLNYNVTAEKLYFPISQDEIDNNPNINK